MNASGSAAAAAARAAAMVKRLLRRRDGSAAAHVPVLGVLRQQLSEACAGLESAVTEVCRSFDGIAGRARSAISETRAMVEGGESASGRESVSATLHALRGTLEGLMDRAAESAALSEKALARIQALEQVSSGIQKRLADLDKLAFHSTLLGLNARIEAAHLGAQAQGFEVVAEEIGRQSRRSCEITDGVRQALTELRQDLHASLAELNGVVAVDRQNSAQARREVEQALAALEGANLRLEGGLHSMIRSGEELAAEVASSVIGLQFQDRVNQRIAHVIDELGAMQAELGGGQEAPAALDQAAAERLRDAYTMASERQVLAAAAPDAGAEADTGPEIELF